MEVKAFVNTASVYDRQGRFLFTTTTFENEPARCGNLRMSAQFEYAAGVIVSHEQNGDRRLLKNQWGPSGLVLKKGEPLPRKSEPDE